MTDKQKKKSQKAEQIAIRAELARCRYLIRNPKFLKDLRRLQEACERLWNHVPAPPADVPKGMIRLSDYESRYGPGTAYGRYRQAAGKVERAIYRRIETLRARWRYPVQEFVVAAMPPGDVKRTKYLDKWLIRYFERIGLEEIRPVEMWREFPFDDGRFIDFHLRIDRTHPVSELLPLIGDKLDFILNPITREPSPARRRRSDKADSNLKVFDLASQGQTFSQIAKELHQRPSTIKSAYLVASRNIFGKPLRKKQAPIASFDPHKHTEKCPICPEARRVEELCPQARSYANQDRKKHLRERLCYSTIAYRVPKHLIPHL